MNSGHIVLQEIFRFEKDGNDVLLPHRPILNEKTFFLISGIIVSVTLTLFADSLSNQLFSPLTTFYATLFSVVGFTPFIEEFAKAFPLSYFHGARAVALHFATNFITISNSARFIVAPMALAVTYYLSYYLYRKTTEIPAYG